MVPDTTELERQLSSLPIRGEIIPTTGIGFGVIVKFETFYLKVYDERRGNAYAVSGYLYDSAEPKFTFSVPYGSFQKFACQLTEDNYLRRPFTITWYQPGLHRDRSDYQNNT